MKVLFVTPEAHPLIKTGGLADVAGALPTALAEAGLDVRVMMPAYPEALDGIEGRTSGADLGDPLGFGRTKLVGGYMPDSGVPVWLIDCPPLYNRDGGPYLDTHGNDWPDNHRRFALLSWVAAYVGKVGDERAWIPAVVHAHDWQCGLAPVYLNQWRGPGPATVFTIHNMQYQGIFPKEILPEVGIDPALFTIDGVEFYGQVSFLKAALKFADSITTVSPTYAREIRTEAGGWGLNGLLESRKADLSGILNGADYHIWAPDSDPKLAKPYSRKTVEAGKATCKHDLQERLGLAEDPNAPLFGVVSRMSGQKGLDLLLANMGPLLQAGAQLAILGSGDPAVEDAFRQLAVDHPKTVAVHVGYSESMSHRIQAGADAFLVPSRFEPCGLTQLYAMRYGTLPVARRTGGLADTIVDAESGLGTGFLFDAPTADGLWSALARCLDAYRQPDQWQILRDRAMAQQFDWIRAAEAYKTLYQETISNNQ
ncbi:glycogen synthase GlgA [Magnetospira sp. QH-2]|uniref:glycogen synthase GlgA n=1 Tax=Magnetospira sp. (strain QH-2) TaxID=1288970 RepID=UPI0003E80AA4|nr:glycogen synthase GlgA [Magnetospira sp. QH-2]CCQ75050.1 GT5 : Glycogen synthase [Magnetospira sp. QH-2]